MLEIVEMFYGEETADDLLVQRWQRDMLFDPRVFKGLLGSHTPLHDWL